MSATSVAVRKAKDAIRTRGGDLCDIIVNGGFTRIANECEVKGIITIDFKNRLTSDMINKDESSRAFELLGVIRSSLATYNLHKPMDDFLCIIHQYGGPAGVAITREIARECGCELQDYPKLTSPGRVTTKAVQEKLTDDDNGHILMTQTKQEMSLESLQDTNSNTEEEAVDTITTDSSSTVYVYPNKQHGLVLVICNEKWADDPMRVREGSCADIDAIKQTFEPLKYIVIVKKDMTKSEMIEYFKNLDRVFDMGFAPRDCFICFIMSHGSNLGIEGTDGAHVSIQKLAEYVQPDKCISLKGKPKLFFVQACRGRDMPNEVKLDSPATAEGNRIVTDSGISAIPPGADFFFGYSTVSNSPSLRGTLLGSHYIQALCKAIDKHYKKLTLYDIVSIVHQKLATENEFAVQCKGKTYRQMAEMVTTLRGNFYFKK